MSVAERYIEAVNNADTPALLALFAEDATLTHPVGTDQGHTEIADFHTDVIFAGQVRMTLSRTYRTGQRRSGAVGRHQPAQRGHHLLIPATSSR